MRISGICHYLYQFSFFSACPKLGPSFPKQSQMFIKIIMVYTHLINSMVTQPLFPNGYSYGNRLHSSTEIKKISIFYHQLIKAYFFLGLVAVILYWYSGNQNIVWLLFTPSDQYEEHVSCWPDDNDVFFELYRYTRS